jgi:uncharacterized protein (UPF0332 family)
MSWADMSSQAWSAARMLAGSNNRRGALNRAYYAAFAALTSEIRKRTMTFPAGYEHPPHVQMGRFVKRCFDDRSKADRQDLRDAIKRLYQARIEADYRHEARFTDTDVRNALFDARFILHSMEIE